MASKVNSIELRIAANEEWIELVTQYTDIFSRHCIGYWARGMERDEKLGWLIYEHGGERRPPEDTPEEVLTAWRYGRELPAFWFRLNRLTAVRAQAEGVCLWGLEWYEQGDELAYDRVIQLALFGEERYG